MKKIFLTYLLTLIVLPCAAQTRNAIKGTVVDGDSMEPLAGVSVYDKNDRGVSAVTDTEGGFSLSPAAGKHVIVCSLLGYSTVETEINANVNHKVVIKLNASSYTIEKIVVSSRSPIERISNVLIGVEKIDMGEMAKIPALFGERDIIRSIQLLPGVKSEGDGSGGFQVRGGTSSQNLILLDDAPIYNAGHLMGIFSTFNDEVLANASLYKGQIPAQFGGATSSVLNITTVNGDMKRYAVDGSIGLLSARLNVEGPVMKDKAAFFVAARRTYFDLLLKVSERYRGNTLNFHDLNAKINYDIGGRDKLYVSFFSGRDNMGLEDLADMQWGNSTATVRWFHKFSDRLYSNTSVILSSFTSVNSMELFEEKFSYDSFVKRAGLRQSFTLNANGRNELVFGLESSYISLKSAEWDISLYSAKEQRDAWENSVWLNDEWKITDRLSLSAGLRFNAFSALGGSPYYILYETEDNNIDIKETLNYRRGEIVKTHFTVEPRLSANFRINGLNSVKAGYSRTSQNIQALKNTSMSLPFDRYIMSSNIIGPQTADQVSLGYINLSSDHYYEFSTEVYYKAVGNVLDYRDGVTFSSEIELERLVLKGRGRAYGIEFCARKNSGRFTGWVSYTLSWSQNKIAGINNDKWYTAGNDRRHDISIVGMHELPRGWHVSATWVYNTGQALTAPSAKYMIDGKLQFYYAERNGYRAPSYHRLDISATHTKKKKNHIREWSFGIYNLYNRYNPFVIQFVRDDEEPAGFKTVQTSLFGIIPSVSYNFRF